MADKVLPIYGGVNIEQIENSAKDFALPKIYDAIFCGRLHPQKGVSQLLNIWKLVLNDQKAARLGIIGNGDIKFELFLKKKAKQLHIDHHLDWLGYVNNEDKYRLYLQSKFLVHSTIYDNNGMVAA